MAYSPELQADDGALLQNADGVGAVQVDPAATASYYRRPYEQLGHRCVGVCYAGACRLQRPQGSTCCYVDRTVRTASGDGDIGEGLQEAQTASATMHGDLPISHDVGYNKEWVCWDDDDDGRAGERYGHGLDHPRRGGYDEAD